MLVVFILLLVGPFFVGRFVYETKYNELKAGYDVATGTLQHVKSRLNDLELASRLVANPAAYHLRRHEIAPLVDKLAEWAGRR